MDSRRTAAAYHHPAPPPPTALDTRAPPPTAGHYPYPPTSTPYPPPPPHLPPIQQVQQSPYGPPGIATEQRTLPPFQEQYHNRSGHGTPAPVNRTYSHDSNHQRTPTTPAQAGSYPPHSAPDGPHHLPPQQGSQQLMDPHTHQGYPPTNGVVHGLPPPHSAPQGPPMHHEQQPPQYMQAVMDPNSGPYPPPPQMYAQPSYGGPISGAHLQINARKKQMRATQACEQCRQRKQKCDEGNPCSFCKENTLSCQYRDTPPAKTDKNMERLLSYMDAHTQLLQSLTDKVDTLDSRIRRVESNNSHVDNKDMVEQNEEEPEPKKTGSWKPGDHRTAPHKLLLLWKSVQPLLKASNVHNNDSYVMEAENRGILRLYSQGEGIDEHDGTQPGAGPASPAHSDDNGSDNQGHSPPGPLTSLWGTGFPQALSNETRRSEPGWGGLKADKSLDLDPKTIRELHESYMKNIHVMHPFLDKQRLKQMLDIFIRQCTNAPPKSRTNFVAHMDEDGRAAKRQRANGPSINSSQGYESGSGSPLTERSPGNAVVYLVLALGKICMHREYLPGVANSSKLNTNATIAHQLSAVHAYESSSPLSTHMSIKPSPKSQNSTPANAQPTPPTDLPTNHHSRSRRHSTDSNQGAQNLDIIPGLAYYAKATEILGDQADGNDLVHAQMFLLAGLYKGQLARVKESMSWLTMAGRAVLSLLDRYKLYGEAYWKGSSDVDAVSKRVEQGRKLIKDKRLNMIVLASWTCLQLESDILAELPLPSSGIQAVEDLLLWPQKVAEDESYGGLEEASDDDEYQRVMLHYTAQMYMRKNLNKIHRQVYASDCLDKSVGEVCDMLRGHISLLNLWRSSLPPAAHWNDGDLPATDILSARLRAKYWGATYIVNRPFLDYALHIMPYVAEGMQVQDVARDVHNHQRDASEIHIFEAIASMPEDEIWLACKRCIDAAMQSTVALDGVPRRLIVTNIHGTAHAQFGNMLVLSATFYKDRMRTLVPEDKFRTLLHRTIGFLRRLGPISPTFQIDCTILERIQKTLFPVPLDAENAYLNEGIVNDVMSATQSFSAAST
ncbi:hypothetical protein LTR62_001170 [Meristemomyces frigidus]|uniref:Zn(2)-C6 fungal-type domain-containing protein n=1 Tax=Meristemomyces frigidus TaxID=1508187 RepID=A0AAN7TT22_9PEZI|nr:hypothetical protein LTR62_001170 [Meristemomyces frigidus]